MDLERIAVTLRPREGWEAIDLGYAMVRRFAGPVYAAWTVAVVPPAIVLGLALHSHPYLALAALWWLKPLFDRVPLAIVSRAFFGEVPSPARILARPRQYLGRGLLADLTWRRLLPWRAYVLPVAQLEELGGAARRRRLSVFAEAHAGLALLLTGIALVFELALFAGLNVLLLLFVPDTVEAPVLFGDEAPAWAPFVHGGLYLVAMSLVEPFYVAAGFALYINRRVHLEGWDIELHFRRLAARLIRLAQVAALLLALGAASLAGAAPTEAPAIDFAAEIEAVLSAPEFQTRETREVWRLIEDEPDEPVEESEVDLSFLHGVGELLSNLLMWAAAVFAALLLAYLIAALWRGREKGGRQATTTARRPETLFGLDLRPESLPADVVAAAEQAWAAGQAALAMSLLYRGALAHVVGRLAIEIPASATEGECVGIVAGGASEPLSADFAALTHGWQLVAYAQRTPAALHFAAWCDRWRVHLGAAR